MSGNQIFEQSIKINASATIVERCITNQTLMHRWLNPALRCQPVGEWNTEIGGESEFMIQIPLLQPTLHSKVVERKPGLVVWEFTGFFHGRDTWECQPQLKGTQLVNRFEFTIPNPIVKWGFKTFAQNLTKADMEAQLQRLKLVAEEIQQQE